MKGPGFCFPCCRRIDSFIKKVNADVSCLDRVSSNDKAKRLKLSERDKEILHEVKRIIESHPNDEPLHLKQLCRETGINEFKLKTGFRMLFSNTPCGYFLELKMLKAQQLLLEPDSTVNGVAYTLGYQYVPNFCLQFKKRFGVTAGEWRLQQTSN